MELSLANQFSIMIRVYRVIHAKLARVFSTRVSVGLELVAYKHAHPLWYDVSG